MNKNYRQTNNDNSSSQTRTGRWDRISKIIKDGISKDVEHNNRYYAKLLAALAEYGAANTRALTGIV